MADEGAGETGGWMRSSKKEITASLCSGLVVLIVVAIVFAGFRTDMRTRQSGVGSSSNTAGISVPNQTRVAQTQPDQRTFAEVGALVKRIADAPEPSIFNVD